MGRGCSSVTPMPPMFLYEEPFWVFVADAKSFVLDMVGCQERAALNRLEPIHMVAGTQGCVSHPDGLWIKGVS